MSDFDKLLSILKSRSVFEHAKHDQKSHGNWAHGAPKGKKSGKKPGGPTLKGAAALADDLKLSMGVRSALRKLGKEQKKDSEFGAMLSGLKKKADIKGDDLSLLSMKEKNRFLSNVAKMADSMKLSLGTRKALRSLAAELKKDADFDSMMGDI